MQDEKKEFNKKDKNGIDVQKVLDYYNKRYSLNIEHLTSKILNQEIKKGF